MVEVFQIEKGNFYSVNYVDSISKILKALPKNGDWINVAELSRITEVYRTNIYDALIRLERYTIIEKKKSGAYRINGMVYRIRKEWLGAMK